MTLKECIDIVDNNKPNQYTIKEKVMWLSFIEAIIINEVLKTHEGYDGRYDDFEGYSEEKLSVPLIVQSPYDRLYTAYLKMKIDEENGETTRYNNSSTLYNSYMLEYRKHYNKTHMPLDSSKPMKVNPIHKNTSGLSDAEYENLKKDMTYILTEYFSNTISKDKLVEVVNEFVQNNIGMLKGKDGYTPQKHVDYWTDEDKAEIDGYVAQLTEVLINDVEGIKEQINNEKHFRGYHETNAQIKDLRATPNDFAYSAESGTVWIYEIYEGAGRWKDSGAKVPDQLTPASKSTPLVNGTASVGKENAYARGDHRHPTDTTRASVTELNKVKASINSKVPIITFDLEDDTPIYQTNLLDDYMDVGVYYILVNDYDIDIDYERGAGQLYRLTVENIYGAEIYQYLENCMTGTIRSRYYSGEWSVWQFVDNQYTNKEKAKLSALPTKEELNARFDSLATDENISNALKNTVSGKELSITDISPIKHTMDIFVGGKNRIDNVWETGFIDINIGVNTGVLSYVRTKNYMVITGGENYIISSPDLPADTIVPSIFYYDENKNYISRSVYRLNQIVKTPIKARYIRVAYQSSLVGYVGSLQFEKGTTATEFEEYINPQTVKVIVNEEEYIPDEYGFIDAKSAYPEVNISSDNEVATIECTYNKDINKVIEELTNAIASLGGNV